MTIRSAKSAVKRIPLVGPISVGVYRRMKSAMRALVRPMLEDSCNQMIADNVRLVIADNLRLTNNDTTPNLEPLNQCLADIHVIKHNLKHIGVALAKQRLESLQIVNVDSPATVGLKSKPTTQADIESKWLWHWCQRMHLPLAYHRKIWELCYVPQAIYECEKLKSGMRGIGFGCGEEPLPSLFVSQGCRITVTDLPPDKVRGTGWDTTHQHTSSLEKTWRADIVDKKTFLDNADLRYVDMNAIPSDMAGQYDFCWSVCALEHLGSIEKGLQFIVNAMDVLKPGGLAVHTTELNYANDTETIDNWPIVMFQRKHFQDVAQRLRANGHTVMELDFDTGQGIVDQFVQVPPFRQLDFANLSASPANGGPQDAHLKLSISGFPCTCMGLIVRKSL